MSRFVPDEAPEPTPDDIALGRRFRRRNRARSFWRALGALVAVAATVGAVYFFTLSRLADTELAAAPGDSTDDAPTVQTKFAIPDEARKATVDYVHDGDTLFINLDGERVKVRLIGIDTPEVGDNQECHGDEATELLTKMLPEGTTVSVVADIEKLDQYGRSLFYLWADDGTFVNLQLLESGAGEFVVYEPNVAYSDEFSAAERRAMDAGLGMWGACG